MITAAGFSPNLLWLVRQIVFDMYVPVQILSKMYQKMLAEEKYLGLNILLLGRSVPVSPLQ